ncbi:MAG TPA: DNA polymerase III subunit epsilon [Caulobacteraceae bacterium]|jgi:DNA polymerase-3 subunit epsilon|nr:DNA polymerase III subunit epsilon [Caulobacteraceae bacterium]
MAREIILDTETTGLDPRSGHRLIEIACVELDDLIPTGRSFHRYIDPERDIDIEAERVHGLSASFLRGKPKFAEPEVMDAFLAFVEGATLIAHNAAFDRDFLNAELERAGRAGFTAAQWIDTLGMAQKRFPGMYNSLDALCKRFKISLAEREKHGALIDCKLLANVYLELRGGRERVLDLQTSGSSRYMAAATARPDYGVRPRALALRSSDAERALHIEFIHRTLKDAALWLQFDELVVSAA